MKITQCNTIPSYMMKFKGLFFLLLFIGTTNLVMAQNTPDRVTNALNKATGSIQGYFDGASKLVFAISAIVGLIGAIKVYSKWNSGDQDTQKVAAAWFGACIFLVVVATVIRTFFSIPATAPTTSASPSGGIGNGALPAANPSTPLADPSAPAAPANGNN